MSRIVFGYPCHRQKLKIAKHINLTVRHRFMLKEERYDIVVYIKEHTIY